MTKKIKVLDKSDNELKLIEQIHTNSGVIKLKYKGEKNTAMVLLREDGTYDEYLYDLKGIMVRYKNKRND